MEGDTKEGELSTLEPSSFTGGVIKETQRRRASASYPTPAGDLLGRRLALWRSDVRQQLVDARGGVCLDADQDVRKGVLRGACHGTAST